MSIDLTKVFEPVVALPPQSEPVRTMVCDVFGTLIDRKGQIDQKLQDFLVWLKINDFDVYLASTDPLLAKHALEKAHCNPLLLESGVQDKIKLMTALMHQDTPHAAIDDSVYIWMDAVIALAPDDRGLDSYLAAGGYTALIPVAP